MYSSLHNHDMFSPLDGFSTPEENLQRCQELGIKSFAITNHGNEYSFVYYAMLGEKFKEVKIIYGVELYECKDIAIHDKDNKYFHLVALAKNERGRIALNEIITKSNFEGMYSKNRISIYDMTQYADDLIICSGCLASKLAKESDFQECVNYVEEYKSIFPHFYLEMQSHSHIDQSNYNNKILELSRLTDTPFVITTDSHAATNTDLKYQARHVQIARDEDTLTEIYDGCYIQSEEEIHIIMDSQIGYDNVCLGLRNTNLIDDLIEEVKMPFQEPQLPDFPVPVGFNSSDDYLKYLVNLGWDKRKLKHLSKEEIYIYKERINYELGVIKEMNFPGYFLVVWDLINHAKENGIMIGAGRGSCAGSMVCYMLGISELNPIKYGLIFERFLNPERQGLPDIDIDVSDREFVINYLIEKYGSEKVCQIINFNYITPLVAIQDVGKVLGFKYNEMQKLSSKFTDRDFNLSLEKNREYLEKHPEYDELIDIASHLSGRLKTVSCHAGGVGIVNTKITDYMAMKLGTNNEHVIQVDKKVIENIGIIKFDILGVQTLNMVKEIMEDLDMDKSEIDINNPNFENNQTPFLILNKGLTNGVFQVESSGMKDLLVRLQANNLGDLSAVLALFRPDTMSALEDYIACKNGSKDITYIHEDMKDILKETYGQVIYQEEMMDIVKKFGARSYGGADKFRKGISKKDPLLVKDEAHKLYIEIKENNYCDEIAKKISSEMEQKGGYCFNKSHSYSYAVLCFQTAYLKQNYTIYFYKALLNMNKDKAGMINKYILDSRDLNVDITKPNVNKSLKYFSISDNKILFGLSAITSVGDKIAEIIINERELNGSFKGFNDFLERVKPNKVQTIMLIKSGAIPCRDKIEFLKKYIMSLQKNTSQYKDISSVPTPIDMLHKYGLVKSDYLKNGFKNRYNNEQILMDINEIRKKEYIIEQKNKKDKYIAENLKHLDDYDFWEFQSLQVFINDNPFDRSYEFISTSFEDTKIGELCVIPGVIAKVTKKKDKNKNTYAFVNIYSSFGLVEAVIWSSQLKEYENLIVKGEKVTMLCKKDSEEKVICKKIQSYERWLDLVTKKKKGDV